MLLRSTPLMAALLFLFAGDLAAQNTARDQLIRDFTASFSERPLSTDAAYTFFHLPTGTNLPLNGQSALTKAQSFWLEFGELFSSATPSNYVLTREWRDQYGGQHFRFQQQVFDYDILGAEVLLHFDADDRLRSAGGFFVLTQVQGDDSTVRLNPNISQPSTTLSANDFAFEATEYIHRNFRLVKQLAEDSLPSQKG